MLSSVAVLPCMGLLHFRECLWPRQWNSWEGGDANKIQDGRNPKDLGRKEICSRETQTIPNRYRSLFKHIWTILIILKWLTLATVAAPVLSTESPIGWGCLWDFVGAQGRMTAWHKKTRWFVKRSKLCHGGNAFVDIGKTSIVTIVVADSMKQVTNGQPIFGTDKNTVRDHLKNTVRLCRNVASCSHPGRLFSKNKRPGYSVLCSDQVLEDVKDPDCRRLSVDK